MADIIGIVLRGLACGVLLGAAAACGPRPLGDFGRASPGVLHDQAMPALGQARAQLAGEMVSGANLTDEEREMRDRVWRFLVSPHARDWFFDVAAELQRTRLGGELDRSFSPDRYDRWLRETRFASSRVRYAAIADDIEVDLLALPETFDAVCAVLEIDRRRQVAAAGLPVDAGLRAEVEARRHENAMQIDWFVRALRFRYESYAIALDHLLVETPHAEAVDVDQRLSRLAVAVELAQRRDFCSGPLRPGAGGGAAIPGRVLMPGSDAPAYRK